MRWKGKWKQGIITQTWLNSNLNAEMIMQLILTWIDLFWNSWNLGFVFVRLATNFGKNWKKEKWKRKWYDIGWLMWVNEGVSGFDFCNCQNCCYSQLRAALLADASFWWSTWSKAISSQLRAILLAVASTYGSNFCSLFEFCFFWMV